MSSGYRTVLRDAEYIPGGGERRQLDVHFAADAPAKAPVVVFFHGGAWRNHHKGGCPVGQPYEPRGVAFVSANYRFSAQAPLPAQIEDAKAVIRWVRAHAAQFGFDPERIAAWGDSAGGTLATLLGVTNHTREFDCGPNLEHSSAVRAVVNYFGPSNLVHWCQLPGGEMVGAKDWPRDVLEPLVGGRLEERGEALRQGSARYHLRGDAAPHLIMHGTADTLVPYQQSVEFAAACQALGVPCQLELREGAGHGTPEFKGVAAGQVVQQFLERWLEFGQAGKATAT